MPCRRRPERDGRVGSAGAGRSPRQISRRWVGKAARGTSREVASLRSQAAPPRRRRGRPSRGRTSAYLGLPFVISWHGMGAIRQDCYSEPFWLAGTPLFRTCLRSKEAVLIFPGVVVLEMIGIGDSRVVDKVIATLVPIAPSIHFYAPELRWLQEAGVWIGSETSVQPGRYLVSIDAMVDDVWLLASEEKAIEVTRSSVTTVTASLGELIRLGKRQLVDESAGVAPCCPSSPISVSCRRDGVRLIPARTCSRCRSAEHPPLHIGGRAKAG